jgi:Na+/glutamate symporter
MKTNKIDPKSVTLFSHPILTLQITLILLGRFLKASLDFIKRFCVPISISLAAILTFLFVPGPHAYVIKLINNLYYSIEIILRICLSL